MCLTVCISGERGHRMGLSGIWEGCDVSHEGGRELFRIQEGGWWGKNSHDEGSLATKA